MGSMHTGLEEAAHFAELAAFYAERARGGVGLIVTGGIAPNRAGWLMPLASQADDVAPRPGSTGRSPTPCTRRAAGSRCRSCTRAATPTTRCARRAVALKAPISPFRPRALTGRGVEQQIEAFVRCAELAREAGYDGVEIMGSEGYLINEFLRRAHQPARPTTGAARTRTACASPVEIVRRTREAVGDDFIIIYRLSMLDLVPGGSAGTRSSRSRKAVEAAGATIINTGIGWHEARIPTIATSVPRARVRLGDREAQART